MSLKMELLKAGLIYKIAHKIDEIDINETRIANTEAIILLAQVKAIVINDKTDKLQKLSELEKLFFKNDITRDWWNI